MEEEGEKGGRSGDEEEEISEMSEGPSKSLCLAWERLWERQNREGAGARAERQMAGQTGHSGLDFAFSRHAALS